MPDLVVHPWNVMPLVFTGVLVILVSYVATIPGKSAASRWLFALLIVAIFGGLTPTVADIAFYSGWPRPWTLPGRF